MLVSKRISKKCPLYHGTKMSAPHISIQTNIGMPYLPVTTLNRALHGTYVSKTLSLSAIELSCVEPKTSYEHKFTLQVKCPTTMLDEKRKMQIDQKIIAQLNRIFHFKIKLYFHFRRRYTTETHKPFREK